MILISDKAQQGGKHTVKENYWLKNDITIVYAPLPIADYVLMNDKIQNVLERKANRPIVKGKKKVLLKNGNLVERNIYEYGVEIKKLDFVGTYDVAVDTKRDLTEIEGNLVGKQHPRFRDECILAQNNGVKLYVLIENKDGIKEIRDLFGYTSTRRQRWFKIKEAHEQGKMLYVKIPNRPPVSGEQLAKAMLTMQLKYGVEFVFCNPNDAGAKVIELLTRQDIGNNPYQE